MIYLDTSCLLKLLRDEPESAEVRRAVNAEDEVVVSSLTELETAWRSILQVCFHEDQLRSVRNMNVFSHGCFDR